ncbi:YHS domain-containing (seleno)protein [Roseibium salinum]|nr:YHS domain-containing (seleno)protein [Roseibium salinum]
MADPAKYAPQYGGFCAFGAAMGFKVPVVPDAWSIVDGKLYLNNSLKVQDRFEEDIPGYIRKATLNWEVIKEKEAGRPERTDHPRVTTFRGRQTLTS